MTVALLIFWALGLLLVIFSYGFTDPNLLLSNNSVFVRFHQPLFHLVYYERPITTLIFAVFLLSFFILYLYFLFAKESSILRIRHVIIMLSITAGIFVFSFPALTYDLFNYITTAKVLYAYHENPYVVMPIEIPDEPYLAFTRAANKLALYGPVWLALTSLPHYLGNGNIWQTIIAFKLMNAVVWLLFSYVVFRVTKSVKNVIFFALNPLVLIETLVSGHNDLYMMILALCGLILWKKDAVRYKIYGCILFLLSWWIKGATVFLTPVLFLKYSTERLLVLSYWIVFFVMVIAGPLREELYPWYAVWLISVMSLLPLRKHPNLVGFTIVLSLALELRHLPYMWMGYYGGPGPIARFLVTVIPVALYILYILFRKYLPRFS